MATDNPYDKLSSPEQDQKYQQIKAQLETKRAPAAEDGTPEIAPSQQPGFNEQAWETAPPATDQEIYQKEAGPLIAPTTWGGVLRENLRVMRNQSPINSYEDSTDGMAGGVLLRQMAYYGLPGARHIGLDYQLTQEGKQKLSLEETQKILPSATEPMHEYIARAMADDKRILDGRKEYAARGGQLGFFGNLGLGLFAGITEPSNIPLAFLTGGGMAAARIKESLGSVFLSNTAQNLALEAATAPQLRREGEPITAQDIILNSIIGGAVGTGLHYLGKGAVALLKGKRPTEPGGAATTEAGPPPETPPTRPRPVSETIPPDIDQARLSAAFIQHEQGRAINPNLGDDVIRVRRSGIPPSSASINHYIFEPFDPTADRSFFVAGNDNQKVALTGLGGADRRVLEVSDNGNFQNMHGDMTEFKLSRMNLLDIDAKVAENPAFMETVRSAIDKRLTSPIETSSKELTQLREVVGGKALGFPPDITIRDALEAIRKVLPEALDDIREAAKTSGIDGYHYVDLDANRNPIHNGLVLFDDVKTEIVGQYEQNTDLIPKMSGEEITQVLNTPDAPETSPYYEPGVVDLAPRPPELPPIKDYTAVAPDESVRLAKEQASTAEQDLREMIQSDPERFQDLAAEIDAVNEQYKQELRESKLAKILRDCMGGNL